MHEPLKHFWVSWEIFIDSLTIFVLGEVDNKAARGIPWRELVPGIPRGPRLVPQLLMVLYKATRQRKVIPHL